MTKGTDCRYGYCGKCGHRLEPVYFLEDEYTDYGYKTGRTRIAVDYLLCEYCGNRECVDDSSDGHWR